MGNLTASPPALLATPQAGPMRGHGALNFLALRTSPPAAALQVVGELFIEVSVGQLQHVEVEALQDVTLGLTFQ